MSEQPPRDARRRNPAQPPPAPPGPGTVDTSARTQVTVAGSEPAPPPHPATARPTPPPALPPAPRPWGAIATVWIVSLTLAALGSHVVTRRALDGTRRAQGKAVEAELQTRLAHLQERLAFMKRERDGLVSTRAALEEEVSRLRAGRRTGTAPLALDAPLSRVVDDVHCTLVFTRANPRQPYLQVQVEAENRGDAAHPGVFELRVFDTEFAEVGRANLNLFAEGVFGELGPGERRTKEGSVRIPAGSPTPAHFALTRPGAS